jgi:hypothetical protein
MLDNQEHLRKYQRRTDNDYRMIFWDCFVALEDSLDVLFFNHLENVREIALCGHHLGQLGRVSEEYHRHLALKLSQMPFLRSLYLSQHFINSELVAFLLGHSDTLEDITLHNCMPDPWFIDSRSRNEPYIYWCELFTALSDEKMKRLRKFVITPLDQRAELPWPDYCEHHIPYAVSNQRVFGYCLIGGVGQICEDYEREFELYMLGEDQKAYDKLMQIVRNNACS